jgi:Domain of unknown function (DUF397)
MRRTTRDSCRDNLGAGLRWRKSSASGALQNCVEVAGLPGSRIGVRDSKDAMGPVLRFTPKAWSAFLGGVRRGEPGRSGAAG